jgi:hypothetical protein
MSLFCWPYIPTQRLIQQLVKIEWCIHKEKMYWLYFRFFFLGEGTLIFSSTGSLGTWLLVSACSWGSGPETKQIYPIDGRSSHLQSWAGKSWLPFGHFWKGVPGNNLWDEQSVLHWLREVCHPISKLACTLCSPSLLLVCIRQWVPQPKIVLWIMARQI